MKLVDTDLAKLLAQYVKLNLQAAMEYRTAFLTQVFGMMLNNGVFVVFWLIVYQHTPGDIAGWAFADVMFLWSLAALGFGLAHALMGNAFYLSRTIYNGELDVFLLQPKPVLPNLLWSRSIISGWGDVLYGILLFALTQPLDPLRVVAFLAFGGAFAVVFTAVRVIFHSLTFFFGNAEDFAQTAGELALTFSLYPGGVFEGATRWLLHSLIPVAFVAYLPARLFRAFDPGLLAIVLVADIAIVVLGFAVFARGLRRYESGNRIGTRL